MWIKKLEAAAKNWKNIAPSPPTHRPRRGGQGVVFPRAGQQDFPWAWLYQRHPASRRNHPARSRQPSVVDPIRSFAVCMLAMASAASVWNDGSCVFSLPAVPIVSATCAWNAAGSTPASAMRCAQSTGTGGAGDPVAWLYPLAQAASSLCVSVLFSAHRPCAYDPSIGSWSSGCCNRLAASTSSYAGTSSSPFHSSWYLFEKPYAPRRCLNIPGVSRRT